MCPTGLVGSAGMSRKSFKHGLLLMWAVFDAKYVARDLYQHRFLVDLLF